MARIAQQISEGKVWHQSEKRTPPPPPEISPAEAPPPRPMYVKSRDSKMFRGVHVLPERTSLLGP